MSAHHSSRTPIDFARLAAALLERAPTLVPQWLPRGVERNGRWYVGDFDGSPGESANVNLRTGQWIDNAAPDQEKGGDLISLYARIHNLNNGQAAVKLMELLGWQREQQGRQAAPRTPPARASEPSGHAPAEDAQAGPVPAPVSASRWVPVIPVPEHAPVPKFRWAYRDKRRDEWVELEAVRYWRYERDGLLLGFVARFERVNSDGEIVKDTLPLTWCRDTTDDRGGHRWHWKQWDAPRPLYLAAGTLRPSLPVLVVEGEKCAEAAHKLIGHLYDVVSWPGGCKTWKLACWDWLAGRTVVLWPDADRQRERLTRDEREQGVDPSTKAVLPLAKQPGWLAMQGVAGELQAQHGCAVRVYCPGDPRRDDAQADGWDVADAVENDHWSAEQVLALIDGAQPFLHPDDAVRARLAGIGGVRTADGTTPLPMQWPDLLLKTQNHAVKAVRDNVVLCIDGQRLSDGTWIPGAEECVGIIAFNEFTNDVVKLRPTPWGTQAGPWTEVDELEMGAYITRVHGLPSMPRGTLEESVVMVAHRHAFHPVRAEFEALRGKWDGTPRLATWLRMVCLEEDEWDDRDPLQRYLALVGKFMVMGIVARVLQPGCKYDYMPILEGAQGVGKSTLARVLGGNYFADTGLVLGDKDSYQNLQGISVYEWGELDNLTKAEITKVKSFISSMKDRFRASFDRRPKDYPRQCTFIGTTNEDHYLVDQTGNRRFWPIRVTRQVDNEWLRQNRDQLFAEALLCLEHGERFHPTPAEQRELFDPQQQQRQIESAIQAACLRYLYDEKAKFSGAIDNGTLVNEITASELLARVGVTIDKQTHVVLRQCTAALRQAGWERFRSNRGDRPWMFRRPAGQQGRTFAADSGPGDSTHAAALQPIKEGALDDIPF